MGFTRGKYKQAATLLMEQFVFSTTAQEVLTRSCKTGWCGYTGLLTYTRPSQGTERCETAALAPLWG